MAKVLALLFLAAIANADHLVEKNYLNDGRFEAKMLRVQENCGKMAAAIKNIEIPSSESAKFVDIVNDVTYCVDKVVSFLNQGAYTIKSQKFREGAIKAANIYANISFEIERNLFIETDKLKEVTVSQLQACDDATPKVIEIFKSDECEGELVMVNQMRLANNIGLFLLTKLKYEMECFKKTNKELGPELDAALEDLCNALKTAKNDDKLTREEALYLMQQFTFIQNEMVVKLENFVHVYKGVTKHISLAKKVANEMSSVFDKFNNVLFDNNSDTAQLLTALEDSLKESHKWVKQLIDCEAGDNTAGALYIRSVLFDGIACLRLWEHELKSSISSYQKA